ncbi:Undecaprenyl-diphosphatase [Caprobacter fermentans]|uniref:Undecaprenyl-diphosphatase n=1 Tax=Caproicibacter fermentans TaxID=2576756 RepID=A0A6N8I154_9FIRM|nr:undecaprenyl-diphosphate phosphatase [Caproicibacter fermentans]MVB11851.1 Undecaprenyl-diphosphatase [Caproicibacter fermentans]OCN00653.1 UDP-diphosphatase [Clostridium sp. W14A]
MTVLQAILEGIIQGATEFLPVSSSGHLSLSQHFLGIQQPSLFFDVMLHLGTLAAVLAVYYKLVWRLLLEFFSMIRDLATKNFTAKRMSPNRRMLLMLFLSLVPLFLLFLPVPGSGRRLKDFANQWATDGDILVEGFSLIATGLLLSAGIFFSRQDAKIHNKGKRPGSRPYSGRKEYNAGDALSVGLMQCAAALFPGLSRSGSTLSAGLIRGISRKTALDYSFVLGIPSILAAAALETKEALSAPPSVPAWVILSGIVSAALVGFLAILLLRWMVNSGHLAVFAIYTLVLGVIVAVAGFLEHRTGINIVSGAILNFNG